jgi:hypothetical protein
VEIATHDAILRSDRDRLSARDRQVADDPIEDLANAVLVTATAGADR